MLDATDRYTGVEFTGDCGNRLFKLMILQIQKVKNKFQHTIKTILLYQYSALSMTSTGSIGSV